MRTTLSLMAACAVLVGSMALAQSATENITAQLRAQGFDRFEIKNGPTQTKIEATDGTRKVEITFDRSSGRILKQETEALQASDDFNTGVSIDTRDKDFVGDDRDDDDDGRDEDDDDRDDDRDDNDDDDDDDDRD